MTLTEILTPMAPFLGAAALEVFYWFNLRRKLLPTKMKAILRSRFYWIITALAILLGGFCAVLLFPDSNAGQLLLAGAALPTLLKKLVGGFVSDNGPDLGGEDTQRSTPARDYFSYA
jgi:hypothetical protein